VDCQKCQKRATAFYARPEVTLVRSLWGSEE